MKRVSQRLKNGRAMTLCCRAKMLSSTMSISSALPEVSTGTPSMVTGTAKLPMKPDGVEKGGEEDGVAGHAVQEDQDSFQHDALPVSGARILPARRTGRLRQPTQFCPGKPGQKSRVHARPLVRAAGQAPVAREHDGLRARAHAYLVEDGREVIAHGLLADEQLCRRFPGCWRRRRRGSRISRSRAVSAASSSEARGQIGRDGAAAPRGASRETHPPRP